MKRLFGFLFKKKNESTTSSTPDLNIKNGPEYIKKFISTVDKNGPSSLLLSGDWCGHGEILFRVYDILNGENNIFKIFISNNDSEELTPTAVKLETISSDLSFLVYDTRRHPASLFILPEYQNTEPIFEDSFTCPKCQERNFMISIGFEIPEDSSNNEDTSWFILSAQCHNCKEKIIVFDDETA